MAWKKSKITYDILVPHLSKPLVDLTPTEAHAFFEWYIEQTPIRVKYLASCVSNQLNIDIHQIDLSPKSLILVWKWFLCIAQIERNPKRRINKCGVSTNFVSNNFSEYISNRNEYQFSLQTEYILRDIGMYMGEVFVKNHPIIYWSYYCKPKSDFYVNTPLLLGFEDSSFNPPFKMAFEPVHMVGVQAANIWDNTQKDTDLYDLYQKWSMFIPNNR